MNISIETPSDKLIKIMLDETWSFDLRNEACELLKAKIKKLVEDSLYLKIKIKQLTGSEQWKQ